MKINFKDIVGKNEQFSCLESLDSLLCGVTLGGPVDATITARHKDEGNYTLSGTVSGSFATACDRCGKEVSLTVERAFQYIICIGRQPERGAEYQCSNEDCETLYLAEAAIDIETIIAEQFVLAIPVQRLCNDLCKGLCKECGIDLNKKVCMCKEGNSNSPFAILKKLQQK